MTAFVVVALLVLVIGLPAMAVFAGRTLPAPKARPVKGDVFWQIGQRYGLRGSDYARVEAAVRKGAVVPARLQPAAHAMAVEMLRQYDRFPVPRRYRKILRGLLAAVVALLVIGLVASHRPSSIMALMWIVPPIFMIRSHRRQRAAALAARDLNSPDLAEEQ